MGHSRPKWSIRRFLNAQSLIVADFNGDNKPDLAVAASEDSTGVAILLGNGDGTFQKPLDFQAQAPLARRRRAICQAHRFNSAARHNP
jgi:hypothetical protein